MAKKKASGVHKQASESAVPSEPLEMREDQHLLWQSWCSVLKHNAHLVRDARVNLEISQMSITFLVPNPETYPVVIQMLVLDFDDSEVTASLTSFIRKSMRSQGEGFHLLREAVLNLVDPSTSLAQFLAGFGLACPVETPSTLPPGYRAKGSAAG